MTESLLPVSGLNIIYARSRNHCIGKDGGLPWQLPLEYRHFEQVTQGYPVIMGRKSYEDHDGLLAGSTNIIVSRQHGLQVEPGGFVCQNLSAAISLAEAKAKSYFVIGGAGLIQEALGEAAAVFETIVDADLSGDVLLPPFDFSTWQSTTLFTHAQDQQHAYSFTAYRHTRT
ncbi:MAG: dihydrofolate reductase [Pseudomonadales bacterium]